MLKPDIVENLNNNQYSICGTNLCNCEVVCQIDKGELKYAVAEQKCQNTVYLYVGDEQIAQYSTAYGFSVLVKWMEEEDIPQHIRDEMVVDTEELTKHVHNDRIYKSLSEFIIHSCYLPDKYQNHFLLVNYGIPIPLTEKEANSWAKAYLACQDPLFRFVDSTAFFDDCVLGVKQFQDSSIDDVEWILEFQKRFYIEKVTLPDVVQRTHVLHRAFHEVLERIAGGRGDANNRVVVLNAVESLEEILQQLKSLLPEPTE